VSATVAFSAAPPIFAPALTKNFSGGGATGAAQGSTSKTTTSS